MTQRYVLLMTDVVSSTSLWDVETAAMGAALDLHDRIIERIVLEQGGTMVQNKGQGDSTFNVFHSSTRAVTAAIEIQRSLVATEWPTSRPIVARFGAHVIETEGSGYTGPDTNLCARIRAAAQGGQILISQEVADLLEAEDPGGVAVADLGLFHLKGVSQPQCLLQVVHPDLHQSCQLSPA